MGKSVLPIAAASVVSAMAGVVLTLVFTAEALDALPDDVTEPLREVSQQLRLTQTRLERVERVLEREFAASRREIRTAFQNPTPGRAAIRTAPSGSAPADASATSFTHLSRDSRAPLARKKPDALTPLEYWKTDEDLRSRWLFASERSSLAAFGAPDEVAARGTSEWWTYWNLEAGTIASEYRLQFNHGRLVEAQLVKWKKPRNLPGSGQ